MDALASRSRRHRHFHYRLRPRRPLRSLRRLRDRRDHAARPRGLTRAAACAARRSPPDPRPIRSDRTLYPRLCTLSLRVHYYTTILACTSPRFFLKEARQQSGAPQGRLRAPLTPLARARARLVAVGRVAAQHRRRVGRRRRAHRSLVHHILLLLRPVTLRRRRVGDLPQGLGALHGRDGGLPLLRRQRRRVGRRGRFQALDHALHHSRELGLIRIVLSPKGVEANEDLALPIP